ncbi:MAG: hypothetical protein HFF65_00915 [Oscillospiraceae bacterium]|jgi:ABC-type glycerol-3-phosphate transport system substrate-binding protein|nr:hypothetical protein [Oscillospiraceae bacterium]
MNRMMKRGAALLLALTLTLGLAACGKDKDNGTEQLTGKVYVPEFLDFNLDVEYISGGCATGDAVYLMGSESQEREETDPATGEILYYYDEIYSLYRIPLDGSDPVKLEAYQPTALPEGAEGNVGVESITAADDGTIWLTEHVGVYTFDLPENFDSEADDKWNYHTYEESIIRRQLDASGNEIGRVDISDLAGKLGVEYVYANLFDRAGNLYAVTETEIIMLDPQLNKVFSVEGEDIAGSPTLLSNGRLGLLNYIYDEEKETGAWTMKTVDPEAQDWGEEYTLPENAYNAYPGGGEYLFYYQNGDSIYGYKAGAAEGEKIFSWIDSDINRSNMEFFSFLPDGRVVVVTREWQSDNSKVELAIMTATDRSELPEKTTLTYAAMYLGYDVRSQIIEFNKTSDKYRIEVRDYSEFATAEDSSAGLTRLNTEIVAGNVPDMLETGSIPLRQYAAKGLLEDLWPFIEGDTDIGGRAGVMEHVLNAAEQDGKLYEIFTNFAIRTVAGPKNIVGDRMSWTLADLQEALAKMPEGCAIFGQTDTKTDMLSNVMAQNADSFVDWSTGQCRFDSEDFKALLAFCNSFPAEYDWENSQDEWEDPYTRIISGKQMLTSVYFSQLRWDFLENDGLFKSQGGAAFIGYPREDGGVGSGFTTNGGVAMSAACKDKEGAWSFMRTRLLSQSTDEESARYWSNFPVNKADFDKMVEEAMTVQYEQDENGQPLLDENGQPIEIKETWWISDDLQLEQGAVTQEQYDRFMALYNATDSVYYFDEAIYDIVADMAGAYFAGDRSLDDTAAQIQSRVTLYVNENR